MQIGIKYPTAASRFYDPQQEDLILSASGLSFNKWVQ